MTRLATATTEEGKTVTYKWVAREFDVSVNHAKRLLFEHARKNDSVLVATHVVSGWTSAAGDDGAGVTRTQVVRLVEGAEALAAAKAALDDVTGEHVYSVRPVDAKDAAVGGDAAKSLPPACVAQTDAMFDASPSTPNALRDNRHSAVRCASAKRDDGPARRVSAKPKPEPAEAKRPAPAKSADVAAAKAKAAPSKAEPAAAASSKPSGAFAGFKPVDKKAAGANPAAPPKPAGRPAAKGAGAMAAMFARAPPKKAPAPAAPEPAPVPVEEDSEEEEEEEEIMEAPRHRRGGGRRVLGLDEDEDEDEETEAEETKAKDAAKAASPAKKSSAKKPPARAEAAKKRKSVEAACDETVTEPVASSPASSKRSKKELEKAPTPEKKPLFAAAAPPVKRGARVKKVITVMDDETGEEFTKTIWVDGDTGEEIKEEDASVETAAMSALEEKTNAKKSAAPRSPAKPAEKKKIDAPAKVSKGIASFFGKK